MSNVFKMSDYAPQKEKRVIEPKVVLQPKDPILDDIFISVGDDLSGEQGEFVQISQKARELLEKANLEIQEMKEKASLEIQQWKQLEQETMEQEREQIHSAAQEEGYRIGYDAGYSSGMNEGLHQYESSIEQVTKWIQQAEIDRKKRIDQSEPFLLDLTIDIAKKVIQRELLTDPHTIIQMIKETLKYTSELKEVTLAVHPSDYALVRSRSDELKSLISSQANLIVIPDHSITEGGSIVRTSLGTLDARVDTQLEEIKQALLEAIEGSEIDELEPTIKV